MTYCLALRVEEGIAFAADTRTNAGVDYVTSYRKLYTFQPAEDRVFVLLAAGSLATTRELVDHIERDLLEAPASPNGASLLTARYMFEAAEYIGRVSRQIQEKHGPALARTGVSGEATLILGGQLAGRPPEMLLIYPQGNYIGASDETPYLQLGETKYGKPILDRLASRSRTLTEAAQLALVSLDATIRSNVTVAAPFDFALYQAGTLVEPKIFRIEPDSAYYARVRADWQAGMQDMFTRLEPFPWKPEIVPAGPPPAAREETPAAPQTTPAAPAQTG